MKLKHIVFTVTVCFLSKYIYCQDVPYKNKNLSIDLRVADLIGRMKTAEKVGQLSKMLGWEMYVKIGYKVTVSKKLKDAVQKQHIGLL